MLSIGYLPILMKRFVVAEYSLGKSKLDQFVLPCYAATNNWEIHALVLEE